MAKFKADPKLVIFFAVGLYILYWREWPPFTKENKARLKEMFSLNFKSDQILSSEPLPPPSNVTEPKVQLNTKSMPSPKPKPDPQILTDFQREIYKQLYMPFDQYPFLYDDTYLQAANYISPGNPNYRPQSGYEGVLMGYRPPVRIDATHSGVPNYNSVYDSFYNDYGWYPPGGSYDTSLDDYYYGDPGELITIGYRGKASARAARSYRQEMTDLADAEEQTKEIHKQNDANAMAVYRNVTYENSNQAKWDRYEREGQKVGDIMKKARKIAGLV